MEIAFKIKAKQGFIYRYLQTHKMSQMALAKEIGIPQVTMGKIINFRWLPSSRNSHSKNLIKKLEDYFHVPIEVLFPPELTKEIAEKLGRHRVAYKEVELLSLSDVPEKYLIAQNTHNNLEETAFAIDGVLDTLTCLEEKTLRLRFGLIPCNKEQEHQNYPRPFSRKNKCL